MTTLTILIAAGLAAWIWPIILYSAYERPRGDAPLDLSYETKFMDAEAAGYLLIIVVTVALLVIA